jgi:hypothetical protein
MTRRNEVEEIVKSFSIIDHATAGQSIVGELSFNGWSIRHGYTPTFDLPTDPSTAQLRAAVATLIGQFCYKSGRTIKP